MRVTRNIQSPYTTSSLFDHLGSVPSTVCLCWKLTPQEPFVTQQDVVWRNITGVSVNGLLLTKTASDAWGNGGAFGTQGMTGDGQLDFLATETNTKRIVGLSTTDANQSYSSINYGIYLDTDGTNGVLTVYENGTGYTGYGAYVTGDKLSVIRIGSAIYYAKNDVIFRTSAVSSSGTLYADCAFFTQYATVTDAKITQEVSSLGFTSHTKDLTLPGHAGVTFRSKIGLRPSTAQQQSGLAAPNIEVDAIFTSDAIADEAVSAGWWDAAEYEAFIVNYKVPDMGELVMQSGRLGEVRSEGIQFTAEGLGLIAAAQQQVGELTLATCRVRDFGDARCGLDTKDFEHSGAVTLHPNGTGSNIEFYDTARTEGAGIFTNGKVTFTSGPLKNLTVEIKSWDESTQKFTLALPMPYIIAEKVTYTAIEGCDRLPGTCAARFDNKINFQGEDTIPGLERVYRITSN